MDMQFGEVHVVNVERGKLWHDGDLKNWSIADWSNAMAGEAGETCNAVKKLRRIQDEIKNISEPGRQLSTVEQAKDKIAEEAADTFLYLDLLMEAIGRSLPEAIIKKFNKTSEEYGFPQRLPAGG